MLQKKSLVFLGLFLTTTFLFCRCSKEEAISLPETIIEEADVPVSKDPISKEPITEEPANTEHVPENSIPTETISEEPVLEETSEADPVPENPITAEPGMEESEGDIKTANVSEVVDETAVEVEYEEELPDGNPSAWYDLFDHHSNQPDLAADGEFKNLTLQPGNKADQLYVTWFSKSSAAGTVTFYPENRSSSVAVSAKAVTEPSLSVAGYYRNSALVDDLESNTVYYYTLKNGNSESAKYKYKTPNLYASDFTFTVAGDPEIGLGDEEVWAGQRSIWRVVLNRMKTQIPQSSFLVTTGDQVAHPSSNVHYDYFLDNSLLYSTPLVPVVGNHDSGTGFFGDHFTLPNLDSLGTESGRDGNYWFTRGNALIMVLNSLAPYDFDNHEDFVRNVTNSHPDAKWRIIISHYSPITMVDRYQGIRDLIKDDYAELGEKYDIDLFIGGHDHLYTRGHFLDDDGDPVIEHDNVITEYTNPGHPVYIVTNGSTNALLRKPSEDYEWSMISVQNDIPSLTTVHVTTTSIQVTTRDVDHWEKIDDFIIYKN